MPVISCKYLLSEVSRAQGENIFCFDGNVSVFCIHGSKDSFWMQLELVI